MADLCWGTSSSMLLSSRTCLEDLPQLSTAELLPGPGGPGWQICALGNNLPQLSAAELLPGPAGPGCQISSVRNNLPQLSTAELLPGPGGPGWQICALGNNLPQLSAAELLPGPAGPGCQIWRSWMADLCFGEQSAAAQCAEQSATAKHC